MSTQPTVNVRNTIAKAGGRPTKFEEEMIPKLKRLAKMGATNRELAVVLGINESTLYEYLDQHPKFSKALQPRDAALTRRVKRSLYHRAVGYSFDSEKVFNDKGTIVRAKVVEHIPPDINAVKFWLTNKAPGEWQDRTGVDITGNLVVAPVLNAARDRLLAARKCPPVIDAEVESADVVDSEGL
jgi:hypothetical protein